jgi:cobalt-precorrin-7 (C5)-methyltransferase
VNKVYIIGVGPGTKDYLLPVAKREIEKSDCLIGGKRALRLFRDLHKEEIPLEGHYEEVIPYIEENRGKKRISLLVSGDPGLYSFLGRLSRVLRREEYVVIPGISAVQVAFAKIGEGWEDSKIVSLHGRKIGRLVTKVRASAKVFLFTDSDFPPNKVAAYLLQKGIGNRKAIVFEHLTYPNERIVETDLQHLQEMREFGLCVLIIKGEMK